ncbi:MAG TPA: hypothetical protein PLB55_02015 [Prosthecobacter sp.]|nr:hypothetical protein [Prosthecobacter sp.]
MKHALAALCLFTLGSSLFAAALSSGASAKDGKPNVLFLFADDYAYVAVRAFGHTDIDAPNLERLAGRGTTFTRA